LVRTKRSARRILIVLALAAGASAALLLVGEIGSLLDCTSVYGQGEPSILLVAVLIGAGASAPSGRRDWRFYAIAIGAGIVLFLSFVSLGRTTWGISALIVLSAFLLYRKGVVLPLLVAGATCLLLIGVLFAPQLCLSN